MKLQRLTNQVTEAIASRDHNNLYITSLFFRDRMKYRAFCTFYAVMRLVDDRVDDLPLCGNRSHELCERELGVLDAWKQVVMSCHRGIHPTASQLEACDFSEARAVSVSLIAAFNNFPVPIKLWTNFFDSMRSDIAGINFSDWSEFLNYAEGATIAPTTIYLFLIAAQYNKAKSSYKLTTGFDVSGCGRYLGIFAYLGHIIRDIAEDLNNKTTRICITREDMLKHGMSMETLRKEVLEGQPSPATRSLVRDLLQRARKYLFKGRALVSQVQDFLESDSRFILELIITMYEQIIKKIESTGFDPTSRHNKLTWKEKGEIIKSVANKTNYSLPHWFRS